MNEQINRRNNNHFFCIGESDDYHHLLSMKNLFPSELHFAAAQTADGHEFAKNRIDVGFRARGPGKRGVDIIYVYV